MTIISKTLSELAVGDVIVDPQGKRHTVTAPVEPTEEDGSGFYPARKGMVPGFIVHVEYEGDGRTFTEARSIFPEFGDPESVKFAIEVS